MEFFTAFQVNNYQWWLFLLSNTLYLNAIWSDWPVEEKLFEEIWTDNGYFGRWLKNQDSIWNFIILSCWHIDDPEPRSWRKMTKMNPKLMRQYSLETRYSSPSLLIIVRLTPPLLDIRWFAPALLNISRLIPSRWRMHNFHILFFYNYVHLLLLVKNNDINFSAYLALRLGNFSFIQTCSLDPQPHPLDWTIGWLAQIGTWKERKQIT